MPTGSRLARRIHSEGGYPLVDLSRINERGDDGEEVAVSVDESLCRWYAQPDLFGPHQRFHGKHVVEFTKKVNYSVPLVRRDIWRQIP